MMVSKPIIFSPRGKLRFYAKLPTFAHRQVRTLVIPSEARDLKVGLADELQSPHSVRDDKRATHTSTTSKRVTSRGDSMKFGITIKPDMSVERILALTRQAEAAGFEYGWIF